jgi:hypothetical protein
MSNIKLKLCSGIGRNHTERNKPLNTVVWDDITALVDNPQDVEKDQAQWIIPSSLLSRDTKKQEVAGEYWTLLVDLDEDPEPISGIADVIECITTKCRYEIYTTKSAAEYKQKSRVLIPLDKPLTPTQWLSCQEILNDKLKGACITPDRSSERLNQIFYLPNKGEYYASKSNRIGPFFAPLEAFSEELATMQEIIKGKGLAKGKRVNTGLDYNAPINLSNSTSSYGKAALEGECSVLAIAPEGGRNERLNKATFSISQLVAGGEVNETEAYTALEQAALSCGLSSGELGKTLASGFEAGMQVPRSAPPKDGGITQVDNSEPKLSAQEQLKAFTANGLSGTMRSQMLEDKFVIKDIAILGQWTTIFAPPNSGKTLIVLHGLMKSVRGGVIKGDDVFYVNADDTFNGQTTKLALLELIGIQVLIPYQNDFKPDAILPLIEGLIKEKAARGKIIVLDTLKKFTALMDKTKASNFGNIVRGFTQAGGTLIALAHTNKNKDSNGKGVYGGTSDIVDDCDCAYIIDAIPLNSNGQCGAVFENNKSRGNVAQKVRYEYTKIEGGDYEALLNSVKRLNDRDAKAADKETEQRNDIAEAKPLVDAILSALEGGALNSKALITIVREQTTYSRNLIKESMAKWAGNDYAAGHRWTKRKADKNELLYQKLINPAENLVAMLTTDRLPGDIKGIDKEGGGVFDDELELEDYTEA